MTKAKKPPGNAKALAAARREASERKRDTVVQTIKDMAAEGSAVSISAVASRAGVGRDFIYKHADLRMRVETAMESQRDKNVPGQRAPKGTDAASHGLRADLAVAQQELKRLREENAQLKADLKIDIGAQIEAGDREAAAKALSEKTKEVDRLTSELHRAELKIKALVRERDELIDDLAAERRAAIELAQEGVSENVRPLKPRA